MVNEIGKTIIKTTAYSDVFNFPLTKKELWRYLIAGNNKNITRESFDRTVISLRSTISFKNNYFFFRGRESLVNLRLRRKKESRIKLKIAKKISSSLAMLPTVILIGISGNLSIMNADKKDDIDFFIVTRKNTLWLTRLMIIFLLQFKGQIRRRGEKNVANKICLNMMIDESALNFSKEKQDLYTAHEIIQMKPIFERNNTYKQFIDANLWVRKFMPNSLEIKRLRDQDIKRKKIELPGVLVSKYLSLFETIAKKIQLWYMRGHVSTEIISNHFLAFHPFSYKNFTLKEYKKRLKMKLKKAHY